MTLLLLLKSHGRPAQVKGYSTSSDAQTMGAAASDVATGGSKASDA